MKGSFDEATVQSVGDILQDARRPLTERFRALFTLKGLGGHTAIDCIAKCFNDPSALLKHELAYCLGQMQDDYAIPCLVGVLKDVAQEPMVRHEAGEALGAIGSETVTDVLKEYTKDPIPEVAETCELALERIAWLHGKEQAVEELLPGSFSTVDPAPPGVYKDTETLRTILLDENASLFTRYRAMFALRNRGDADSALALAEGLKCRSALFRHEIAYVLGQLQDPATTQQLMENLRDTCENPMVRHECAEALGAIATDECTKALSGYLADSEVVVRESCEVALDMCEHEHSDQLEYADGLHRVVDTNSQETS